LNWLPMAGGIGMPLPFIIFTLLCCGIFTCAFDMYTRLPEGGWPTGALLPCAFPALLLPPGLECCGCRVLEMEASPEPIVDGWMPPLNGEL